MNLDNIFEIRSNTLEVKTGNVLISTPFFSDIFFTRSVIFIIDNDDTGTLGLIINKRLSVSINDLINDFPKFDCDVYIGGPVNTDQVFFIHTLGFIVPDSTEIFDGIYWSTNINAVKSLISNGLITRHEIRFFIGYAGWEAGQLRSELQRNAWIVGDIPSKHILKTAPNKMWGEFAGMIGSRYEIWNKFPLNPSDN